MGEFVTVEEIDRKGGGKTFRFWPVQRGPNGELMTAKGKGDPSRFAPGEDIPISEICELPHPANNAQCNRHKKYE